jgi:hypothetical protein
MEHQETIYMPNEIFPDLQAVLDSSKHIAFAYSYYYYICYLYRYCRYIENGNKQTQQLIKERLGYAANNKHVDYIIKKDGLLDQAGYTRTTTDFPISWTFDAEGKRLKFETISQLKESDESYSQLYNDRNFKIKIPLKGFYRSQGDEGGIYTGTFYDVSNTYGIPYSTFKDIIEDDKLGVMGFYLYGFLKYKCAMFRNGYQASRYVLADETKIAGAASIVKYTYALYAKGFIDIERKVFILENAEKEANIYRIVGRTT